MAGQVRGFHPTRTPGLSRILILGLMAAASLDVAVLAAEGRQELERSWMHLYVSDRRQRQGLETAKELAARGQLSELIPQVQFLLDQPTDSWTSDDQNELVSVRRRTRELLEDGRILPVYLLQTSPQARLELARAREAGTVAAHLNVVRRYFVTPEGFSAADWLVRHWLDEGDWSRAAALGERMTMSEAHASSLTPRFVHMTMLALDLAGWKDRLAAVRERLRALPRLSMTIGTQSAPMAGLARRPSGTDAPQPMTPPILEPDWQQPLESRAAYPHLDSVLGDWSAGQRNRDESIAVGWRPVVAQDQLIFRDVDTIRSISVQTGQTLWRYRTRSGLGDLLSPADNNHVQMRIRSQMWDAAAANSLVSGLATDGQRVYAVDGTESLLVAGVYGLESNQVPQFSRRESARNELIALNLMPVSDSQRLAWSTSTLKDHPQIQGHAFLGPPAISGTSVFGISERDRELCVTAFDGATGDVLWQQPLAEASLSIIEDRGRASRACTPCVVRDLLVCPTHIGLLVAVDLVTGDLCWVHNSLEHPADLPQQRIRNLSTTTQRRHSSFVATPWASGLKVIYLPSQSEKLYALDALSGQVLWSQPAGDAEYIAEVDAAQAVVAGKSSIVAYSLETGEPLWRTALDGGLAGYGTVVDGSYLLPQDNGDVLTIDLATGRRRGFRLDHPERPLGHLLATSDRVIAVGAYGATAYPQTHAVLARLSVGDPTGPNAHLLTRTAEVHLVEGDLPSAIASLEAALPLAKQDYEREQIRQLLRESYFLRLRADPDRTDTWLARIAELTRRTNRGEVTRWLIAATARSQATGSIDDLLEKTLELARAADVPDLYESPEDEALKISVPVWLRCLRDELEPESARARLDDSLLAESLDQPLSPLGRSTERILEDSATTLLRLAQAQSLDGMQQRQQALLLLQRLSASDNPEMVRVALQGQARLYSRSDMPLAAGRLLGRVEALSSARLTRNTVTEVLGDDLQTEVAWEALERQRPTAWPVRHVRVSSQRRREYAGLQDPRHRDAFPYEDYQRQITSIPATSPWEWMLKNTERGTEIGAFDKLTSRKLFEKVLPFGASPPSPLMSLASETLIPFSLPGEIRALSPLQGATDFVAWSLKIPEWTSYSGQPISGPSTAKTAWFQWKNVLLAVDPATGRLLWRRNDLEAGSGLTADPRIGLLADDDIVFVLAANRLSYRILEASTGRVIRRGQLQQDERLTRFDVGRMILHLSEDVNVRRIRLWDPKTDSQVLDEPLRSRQLLWRFGPQCVAWMTPEGRVKVYSVPEARMVVDVDLDGDDLGNVGSLRAFLQNGRYYLSIGRNQPLASTMHFHMPIPDKMIPETLVRDDLIAVADDGRSMLWRQAIPQRSFLQLPDLPLPFLLAGALVRDKRDPNRRWLRMEAIDPETGLLLGAGDHLPNDRLLWGDYDGVRGVMRLIGRSTEITLDFSRQLQNDSSNELFW